MYRRVLVKSDQDTAQVDDFFAIEFQGDDSRATGRRKADDLLIVGAPGEMLTQALEV